MTKSEMQAEALANARASQSVMNYPAIFEGFIAKGIAEVDIKPRENVFTFQAWKALGRSVKKGEHGVRVVTFIECSANERDPVTGEERPVSYRRPHTTTVFHISQTEPTAERDARIAAVSGNGWSSRRTRGRHRRSQWASGHGRYPASREITEFMPDPGELAADRWNETRGDHS
jgi:hypothetical protein